MSEKIYDKALHNKLYDQEVCEAEAHNNPPMGNEFIKRFAKEVLQLIKEGLLRDGMVRIHNFGTFRLKMSKTRTGYNPQTRKPIKIPAQARVLFTPAKVLRENIEPNPKPIVPIAAHDTIIRKPEPPKTENPIAVTLPIHATNATTEPETNELTTDNEILAKATLASLSRNPALATQPTTREHAASTNIFKTDKTSSRLDNESVFNDQDDAPALEALTSKQPIADPVTSTKQDIEPNRYDVSNGRTQSQPLKPGLTEAFNTDANDERFNLARTDYKIDRKPVVANKEHPQVTDPAQQDRHESASSWRAIGIVSALMLLLLITLLYWLLPLNDPGTPAPYRLSQQSSDTATVKDRENTIDQTNVAAINENNLANRHTTDYEETASTLNQVQTKADDAALTTETVKSNSATANQPFFTAKSHKVIFGDNLWKLANRHYINPFLWPHIYYSNNTVIRNPNVLKVNNTIILPTLHGHPSKLSSLDRRSIAEGYWLLYQHYTKTGKKNAHYALIGVKWFDKDVLNEHFDQILLDDQNRLNAKRSDNRMIERAMMYGS